MGISGFIIKKDGEMTLEELTYEMRIAAERAGLEYHEDTKESKFRGVRCIDCCFYNYFAEEDVPGKEILPCVTVYARNSDQYYHDWIIDGGKLYEAVAFEELGNGPNILLELLYEYLKRNPNDYFYAGYDWYYTLEDIIKIRQGESDVNWYIKDPKQIQHVEVKEDSSVYGRMTAGHIIKQSKEKAIYEIIHDVETAAERAHLMVEVDSELYQNEDHNIFAVAHITEEVSTGGVQGNELLLYILFAVGAMSSISQVKWIEQGANLFRAIIFHQICGREKMLLDFLYEYFRLNPNDYFVDAYTLHEGDKWYYTPEDIKMIKERDFDDAWCYKKPYIGERTERETRISNHRTGIPAYLLKRNGEKTIHEIMKSVQHAAEQAGLEFWIDTKPDADGMMGSTDDYEVCYIEGCSDNGFWGKHIQQLQMYICSTKQEFHRYDWIQDGADFMHAVTFPCVSDNEEILLIFLNEYFKIYPEDYFVVGNISLSEDFRWYYTKEDVTRHISKLDACVQKILQDKRDDPRNHNVPVSILFDDIWCYDDPHTKKRTWSYKYEEPYFSE